MQAVAFPPVEAVEASSGVRVTFILNLGAKNARHPIENGVSTYDNPNLTASVARLLANINSNDVPLLPWDAQRDRSAGGARPANLTDFVEGVTSQDRDWKLAADPSPNVALEVNEIRIDL